MGNGFTIGEKVSFCSKSHCSTASYIDFCGVTRQGGLPALGLDSRGTGMHSVHLLNRNDQDAEAGGQSSCRETYVFYLDSPADTGITPRKKAAGGEHIYSKQPCRNLASRKRSVMYQETVPSTSCNWRGFTQA